MALASRARTTSPWWASLLVGAGLLLVLLALTALQSWSNASVVTYAGVALLGVALALRTMATLRSSGERRRVERTLLLTTFGIIAGLGCYWLALRWGYKHISRVEAQTLRTPLTLIAAIFVVASAIPHLMIELALGVARRTRFDFAGQQDAGAAEGVEYLRVRDIGWSGLSIGLAAAFLMVTCNVANQRNVRRDVSYFKTSSPGDSTRAMVNSASEPLKVLLFFPAVNEVKAEVRTYFDALASATGKLTVEAYDRMVAAELAAKYKVSKDGVAVIVRGDKSEIVDVGTDMERERRSTGKLRNLDRDVNAALLKVLRDKRKAYITVGHGELNDRGSLAPMLKDKIPERQSTIVRQALGFLGYDVIDLNPSDLAVDVPKDATVVLLLGPAQPLEAAELAALDRYLTRGGRLLAALNPLGDADLGPLNARLGVTLDRTLLTDNKSFYPERNSDADFRNVATTQVSAHASTTTLSRASRARLPLVSSGSLRDAEFAAVPGSTEKPRRTYIIKAMDTTWADTNNDLKFDATSEKRDRYNVGAAIEGPRLALNAEEQAAAAGAATGVGPGSTSAPHDHDHEAATPAKDKEGFRALVYSNANFFADAATIDPTGRMRKTMIGGDFFVFDAVRWLGGEEVFSGEVVSEDDKPIQHTKNEDGVWFMLTIVGAPLLVLGVGLFGTWWRRRRSTSAKSPKTPTAPPPGPATSEATL
ncbi:MAG TPA: Gldg family protein [Kofleriaceae bacterium]|nr:Gldg family protein [Kofleriaceae bacterium]